MDPLNLAVLGRSCVHPLPCQQHGLQSPALGRCHTNLFPCLWVRQYHTSSNVAGLGQTALAGGEAGQWWATGAGVFQQHGTGAFPPAGLANMALSTAQVALGGAQEILEHAWGQTGIAGEQEW